MSNGIELHAGASVWDGLTIKLDTIVRQMARHCFRKGVAIVYQDFKDDSAFGPFRFG